MMHARLRSALSVLLALAVYWSGLAGASETNASSDLRVLMYHRVGEDAYPTTSVTVEQFEAHLRLLRDRKVPVVALSDAIAARAQGRPLPAGALAITFDDGYRSVWEEAAPRLADMGFPFTVFVATQAHNDGYSEMMSWDQLRRLPEFGGTIGAHGHTHASYAALGAALGADGVQTDLAAMEDSFTAALGHQPSLFAFPYGEASNAAQRAVRDAGYTAAFGQHSGVVGDAGASDFYLPRFALNEHHGEMDRFSLILKTRALPATFTAPDDPAPGPDWAGPVRLTPAAGTRLPTDLTCYAGNTGAVLAPTMDGLTLTLAIPPALRTGRLRINCTAPDGAGRWFWAGTILTFTPEGSR